MADLIFGFFWGNIHIDFRALIKMADIIDISDGIMTLHLPIIMHSLLLNFLVHQQIRNLLTNDTTRID